MKDADIAQCGRAEHTRFRYTPSSRLTKSESNSRLEFILSETDETIAGTSFETPKAISKLFAFLLASFLISTASMCTLPDCADGGSYSVRRTGRQWSKVCQLVSRDHTLAVHASLGLNRNLASWMSLPVPKSVLSLDELYLSLTQSWTPKPTSPFGAEVISRQERKIEAEPFETPVRPAGLVSP